MVGRIFNNLWRVVVVELLEGRGVIGGRGFILIVFLG